jgi:hypothetical protein
MIAGSRACLLTPRLTHPTITSQTTLHLAEVLDQGLPAPAKAGVGSAINNAIRQVGSALGVAVLGSVLSARYASSSTPALKGLPAPAVAAARRSVGAATQVAARLGPSGTPLLVASRSAFVAGMGSALLVGLGFVLAGALVALLFLPAHPTIVPRPQTNPA